MKTKLQCLFIGLALLAVVHPALAQQSLSIVPVGNQALLFWPATATNYVLQSTTNLVSSNWGAVNDAVPVTINNTIIVIVSYTSRAMYFRLYNTNPPAGMALIPAGAFTIGDTLDGEGDAVPTNVVYVSAFYMDVNLVSSNQWQSVYNWATTNGYGFDDAGNGNASNQPVWFVDWYDTVKWCNARSQQAGLKPAYYTDTNLTQVYTNGDVDISNLNVNWMASGYRLPTEAEWEKAARGGLSGQRFPGGNLISETNANYNSGGGYSYDLGPAGYNTNFDTGGFPYTSPVGYFAPNGYGLYDMAGNLWEWCWDWYAAPPDPTGSPYLGGTNPRGPASSPYGQRVLRGGGWAYGANYLRCAARFSQVPDYYGSVIGFRCVRGL
jgi:formylglycine-generating enzyme required for sulfatase activity